MTQEQAQYKEILSPGQLYFLSHPGSELFSGYGLTTQEGRKDRLTGLLMVDRPHPVNPQWLAEIEARYGDYELVSMTATGERGILTQMRIAAESVPVLERFAHPIARDFARVLKPLLETPPSPILKLRWDEEKQLWSSDFWLGLPPMLQAIFDESGPGCFAATRNDGTVGFIAHAADGDIERLRAAPLLWQWELVRMPTAPLIRFCALIVDNPYNPYRYEHFLNVEDRDQAHCLAQLVNQGELSFDFFGSDYEYAYSKQTAHPPIQRARLQQIVEQAIAYYGDIAASQRDFDRAKAVFQGSSPL